MSAGYIIRKTKKDFRKGPVNGIKVYLKKKKKRKLQYAHEQNRNLSEEKNKKRQYEHECYNNLPEDEKQRLVEYRKKLLAG